jgi:hypothetical protein
MTEQVNKYGVNLTGLKHKDTYEDVIGYINTTKNTIKYPDRRAKQLRNSPYLSFLDGEGLEHMKEQQINAIKEQHKDDLIREAGMSSNSSNSAIESRIQSSAASSRSYMSAEPEQFDMTIDDTMEDVEQEINIALDAQAENEEAKREKIIHILQTHLGEEVLSDATVQFAHRMAVEQPQPELTVSPPGLVRQAAKAAAGVVVNRMIDAQLAGASIPIQAAGQVAKVVAGGVVSKITGVSSSSSSGQIPVTDSETQHPPKGPRGRPRRIQLEPSGPELMSMMVGDEGSQIRRPAEDSGDGNGNRKKTKQNKKERRRLQSIEEGTAEGGATEGTKIQDVPHTKIETSGLGEGKLETNKPDKPEQKEKTTGTYSKSSAGIKSDSTDRMPEPEPKKKPGRPKGSSKGATKDSAPPVPSYVKLTGIKSPAQPATSMIAPSKIGIQKLREIFEEAKNKKKLSTSDTSQYMILYDEWREAKGDKQLKKAKLDALKALYKTVLYKK